MLGFAPIATRPIAAGTIAAAITLQSVGGLLGFGPLATGPIAGGSIGAAAVINLPMVADGIVAGAVTFGSPALTLDTPEGGGFRGGFGLGFGLGISRARSGASAAPDDWSFDVNASGVEVSSHPAPPTAPPWGFHITSSGVLITQSPEA